MKLECPIVVRDFDSKKKYFSLQQFRNNLHNNHNIIFSSLLNWVFSFSFCWNSNLDYLQLFEFGSQKEKIHFREGEEKRQYTKNPEHVHGSLGCVPYIRGAVVWISQVGRILICAVQACKVQPEVSKEIQQEGNNPDEEESQSATEPCQDVANRLHDGSHGTSHNVEQAASQYKNTIGLHPKWNLAFLVRIIISFDIDISQFAFLAFVDIQKNHEDAHE